MKLPTDQLDHEGESYSITYNEHFACSNCGHSWEETTEDDPDEVYRTEPKNILRCPDCGRTSGIEYRKVTHYYLKLEAVPIDDPPLNVDVHAEALRHLASEFEALEKNGWELTQSDGVHVYFEKVEIESTDSDHKVTDTLE